MWLDRFSGQSTPSASPIPWNRAASPAPGRSSLHLSRNAVNLRRPELPQRVSSWSGLVNGTPESQREPIRASLKAQLSSTESNEEPLEVLSGILKRSQIAPDDASSKQDTSDGLEDAADVDFGGLSLEDFAGVDQGDMLQGLGTFKRDPKDLEDLHKSIKACDEILVSVEKNLTVFKADLANVSAEIETLQTKSTSLTERLQRRKDVEARLGPEVNKLALSPAVVRKITEGVVDEGWAKALQELERVSRILDGRPKTEQSLKAADDMRPFLDSLKDRAVERIRDHVVAQIKALRSPSINAQVLQRNALSRFKDAYAFLARHQPKLEEEIAQAYVNTMRWYYLSNFTRYRAALDKLHLHVVDKTDALIQDDPLKRSMPATGARGGGPFDPLVLGRRIDVLRTLNPQAISSFVAEEDKAAHFMEIPFRAFNLALIDNASTEFSFMTEFFSNASFHTVSRRFLATLEPTLALGQSLTKQLVESSTDALGILLCLRLNQHYNFELQRRKVSSMEGYVNGTNMLLWPRFQQVMDLHTDALKKTASTLSGKPIGSALSLTSNQGASSVAPHPTTQRFANFLQGILMLSRDAGDDEPVHRSLARLRDEFQALLSKLSKGIADAKKRERFLVNNYSLVGTIIAETEGSMAEDFKSHFTDLKDAGGG